MSANGPIVQPITVLDSRVILRGSAQVKQVLIQWELASLEEATWEDVTWVGTTYHQFNLEDKVVLKGKGNVTCEEERERLAPKLIRENEHVSIDVKIKGGRQSTRIKRPNVLYKEFVTKK